MTITHSQKRTLKITGYLLGILLLLFTSFHLWFIHHTKELLESMVEKKSNGNLKLRIKKLSYHYFSREMTIREADFFTVDTAAATTAYQFNTSRISIRLKALFPFILEKKLLIDSLNLRDPDIVVTRLRYNTDTTQTNNDDFSIPSEMGRIYKSIQGILQELQVEKFQLNNGKFTLLNKADPSLLPVKITHIDFQIDNLRVDSSQLSGKEKILFSDNVILSTHHQQINFPDGRHQLNFTGFHINLKKQLVEFDSCTISGTKTDSSNASFSVFFNKLRLSNVDFDTLYRSEVIKADTVFCLSPRFTLVADISKKKDSSSAGPKLEKIIQQLTGDLLLANVIVSDASFDITTYKNGRPSSFTSEQNNFEMQGLKINQDARKPISVETFRMAIRNYENFIKDSSYRVQFDSVIFRDDRIYLSSFLFNKLNNGQIVNAIRIPQFYLGGLSWDDLIFEKRLKAEQATLFNPTIHYQITPKTGNGKGERVVLNSLAAINDFVDVDYLDIQDGNLDISIGQRFRMQLKNATMAIQSHALLNATELATVKNSITDFNFEEGRIKAGELDILLKDIRYLNQSGQLSANDIRVNSKKKDISIAVSDAFIENMAIDEKSGDIRAGGISWKKGNVMIEMKDSTMNGLQSILLLNDVNGHNTGLTIRKGENELTTFFDQLRFSSLTKSPGKKLRIDGLIAAGTGLQLKLDNANMQTGAYQYRDRQISLISQLDFHAENKRSTSTISAPEIRFVPKTDSLIAGKIDLDLLTLEKPVINWQSSFSSTKKAVIKAVHIKELSLLNPVMHLKQINDSVNNSLYWQGNLHTLDKLFVKELYIHDGLSNSLRLDSMQCHLSHFILTGSADREFNSSDGEFAASLNNMVIQKDSLGQLSGTAFLSMLDGKKLYLDNWGRKKGSLALEKFKVYNIGITSGSLKDLKKTFLQNPGMQVKDFSGNYTDTSITFSWQQASFDKKEQYFRVDSFAFAPILNPADYMSRQVYQTDYITLNTGNITIEGFDADKYLNNEMMTARYINIDNALLQDFRDRRLPKQTGIKKLLPASMIHQFPLNTKIDSIHVINSKIIYAELNEKTGQTGTIPVSALNVTVSSIKNYGLGVTDSIRILATGNIMDKVPTRLSFSQSYHDSAGGFSSKVNMESANATIINPLLIPLAGAKLRSGLLDTLYMEVTGNDDAASGIMHLYYHDLKISLLKNGDINRKTLKTRIINFFANTFIIKNKNNKNVSTVFFKRMKDRSAIQYLVKLFLSGVTSSVGLKTTKKNLRQYKKETGSAVFPDE